jgi:hypothetical protein
MSLSSRRALTTSRTSLLDPDLRVTCRQTFLNLFAIARSDDPPQDPLARVVHESLAVLGGRTLKTLTFSELVGLVRGLGNCDLLLLRQVTLFGHFMVGAEVTRDPAVDWDWVLSRTALCERYGLDPPEVEVPRLDTIALPDDWVEMILPEYGFPIDQMQHVYYLDLISGQLLTQERDVVQSGQARELLEFLAKQWLSTAAIVLIITGQRASELVFVNLEFGRFILTQHVWLDRSGFADIGLTRGSYPVLDREKLTCELDRFMSGAYIDPVNLG